MYIYEIHPILSNGLIFERHRKTQFGFTIRHYFLTSLGFPRTLKEIKKDLVHPLWHFLCLTHSEEAEKTVSVNYLLDS